MIILFLMSLGVIGLSTLALFASLFFHAYEKKDWKLVGLLAGYHLFLLFSTWIYSLLYA